MNILSQARQIQNLASGEARQFAKFALVGGAGFLVDAGVLAIAINFWDAGPVVGRVISIGAAMIATWLLNRSFAFRAGGRPTAREGMKYAAVKLLGQLTNFSLYVALLSVMSKHFGAYGPYGALGAAALIVMAINYVLLRRFVFRVRPVPQQ